MLGILVLPHHKDPNARLQEMGTPENSSRDKDLGGLGGLGFGVWGFRVWGLGNMETSQPHYF